MDLWMALKVGLKVRAFFPAADLDAAVQGEYLTLRVKEIEAPRGPEGIVVGEVLDAPEGDVGVKQGGTARIPASRIEEIVG